MYKPYVHVETERIHMLSFLSCVSPLRLCCACLAVPHRRWNGEDSIGYEGALNSAGAPEG
jgi:hypothetical protein